jgi:hypothetical protein
MVPSTRSATKLYYFYLPFVVLNVVACFFVYLTLVTIARRFIGCYYIDDFMGCTYVWWKVMAAEELSIISAVLLFGLAHGSYCRLFWNISHYSLRKSTWRRLSKTFHAVICTAAIIAGCLGAGLITWMLLH